MSTAVLIPESGVMPDTQAKIDAFKSLGGGLAKGVDTIMLNKALQEMKDTGEGGDPSDKYFRTMAKYGPHLSDISRELMAYQDPMKRMERQEAKRGVEKSRFNDVGEFAIPKIERHLGPEFSKLDKDKQEKILKGIWSEKVLSKIDKGSTGLGPQEASEVFFEDPDTKRVMDLERRKLETGATRGGILSYLGDRFRPGTAKESIGSIIKDSKESYGEDSQRLHDIVREQLGSSSHLGDRFIVEEAYGKIDTKGLPRIFSDKKTSEWIKQNKSKYNPMQMKVAIIDRYRKSPHTSPSWVAKVNRMISEEYPGHGDRTLVDNSRDITP